jgi:hypothetical protein
MSMNVEDISRTNVRAQREDHVPVAAGHDDDGGMVGVVAYEVVDHDQDHGTLGDGSGDDQASRTARDRRAVVMKDGAPDVRLETVEDHV